ncbi:hypothetical protein [Haloferax sp. Atlit-6N]|uniref:hypothetical protein n=1 Tax=Haloferax sp. Atlit-6N TaxID=2077205 RepID=UPI0011C067FE|nr:hypothetical protein [Haloferax sp. Atlit-6N]
MAEDQEFGAGATLAVDVDRASLRHTRDVIQDTVGDLDVTVRPGGASAARVDGGGVGGGDLSLSAAVDAVERHGEMRSKEAALGRQLAAEQLEVQRHIWETVGDIAETMDDGGLIGGAVGDLLVEAGGGAAGETAGAVASEIPDTIGDILGTAAGEVLGKAVSDLLPTGGSSVSITKPEWVPLKVESPGDVDVNTPSDLDVREPDWAPLAVQEPEFAVGVDRPDWKVKVDDPSPLRVETPVLEVEDVPPLEVDMSLSVAGGGGGGAKSTGEWFRDNVEAPLLGDGIAESERKASNYLLRRIGVTPTDTTPVGQPSQGSRSGGSTTASTTIDYGPTYNFNFDTDRIIRELKQAHRRDVNNIESRLDSVESDVDSLQRALRGR